MKLSGLNIKADPPDGGKIINDCILIDNAMNPVKNLIPKSEIKTIEKWMKLAFDIIVKRGITNIHDAWQDPITIDILKKIDSNGELPIRCYGMIGSSHEKILNQFLKNGIYVSEKYTIRSVKAFIDGALGSRGAALLEPYSDDLNNCGLILIETEKFIELAKKC